MKVLHLIVFLHVFLACCVVVNSLNMYLMTGIMYGIITFFRALRILMVESCNAYWIHYNPVYLKVTLDETVYGQHIASKMLFKAMHKFAYNHHPKKPLVLSLHGWAGTGKKFTCGIIAETIYRAGRESKFIHSFRASRDFPNKSKIALYKSQIKKWIKGNISACEYSMFIFDEMDKMPHGLIDVIEPFLDPFTMDGIASQKSIFIFLSYAGGDSLFNTSIKFWKEGQDRSKVELSDLDTPLCVSVFNNKESGLFHTSLIAKNLIDYFVPFFPLEYRHVVQCTMAEMKARGMKPNKKKAYKVAYDVDYFPQTEKLYSVEGCKAVKRKV